MGQIETQTQLLDEILRELKEISTVLKGKTTQTQKYVQTNGPDLFDVGEVSKLLKVSKSWIYGNVSSKKISYRKIGKYLRFSKDDIDQMVKQCTPADRAAHDTFA